MKVACLMLCSGILFADFGLASVWGQGSIRFTPPPRPQLVLFAPLPPEAMRAGKTLEKALDEPVTAEFADVPFCDVIAAIRKRCNVKIEVVTGLHDAWPVQFSCVRLPLRDALTRMLGQSALGWEIRDGGVFVAGEDAKELEPTYETKVYAVGDLADDESSGANCGLDSIAEAVTACVRPDSWEATSGGSRISAMAAGNVRAMAVRQTAEIHTEVEAFLARLRRTAKGKPDEPEDSPRNKLKKALAGAVSIDFNRTPIDEVLAELAKQSGAQIVLDPRLAIDSNTRREQRVTKCLSKVSLRAALRLIFRDLDLAYGVRRGFILVSTPERLEEEAEEGLCVRIYPVGDLADDADRVEELSELTSTSCCETTWDMVGGPGSIHALSSDKLKSLVVRQTEEVHEEIAELLAGLRHIAKETAAGRNDARWPRHPHAATEAEIAVWDALAKPVMFDFIEMPLADLPAVIRKQCGINVVLDRRALSDIGIGIDTPISRDLKGISLRSALGLILRELDLTYLIEDEALVITTPEEAEMRLPLRVYSVADLVDRLKRRSDGALDYGLLTDLITSIVQPCCWDAVGGPGTVCAVDFENVRVIVVNQTPEVHAEIEDLLAALRRVIKRADDDPGDVSCDPIEGRGKAAEAINRALAGKVSFDFKGKPLSDVVGEIAEKFGVEIQIDRKALDDVGVDADTPIIFAADGISLRSVLDLMLRQLDLCYIVQDEVVLVTTPEEAEQRLSTRFYPVTDLVAGSGESDGDRCDCDSLIDLITCAAQPTMWDYVGGPGSVFAVEFDNIRVLVVSQTQEAHEEITDLLAAIRRTVKLVEQGKVTPVFADRELGGSDGVEAVRRALAKNVSLEVDKVPLAEAVAELRKQAGVNILFDRWALDDVGVATDTPVSISVENVPLRATLKQLLGPHDLTAVVSCEVLMVTSTDEVRLTTAVYPVGDLTVFRDENDELWYDFDTLNKTVTLVINNNSWDAVGGPGSIAGLSLSKVQLLVVSQTEDVHHMIDDLLAKLRAVAEKGPEAKPPRRKRPPKPKPMEVPPGTSQGGGGFF